MKARQVLIKVILVLFVVGIGIPWSVRAGAKLPAVTQVFAASIHPPLSNATVIAAGYDYTCVLTSAKKVKCWGGNQYGQLGDGTTEDRLAAVDAAGLPDDVVGIVTGYDHTCVLTSQGGVKCWGKNNAGQLGNGEFDEYSPVAVDVVGLSSGVKELVAGYRHTCALTTDGGVKCWGDNYYGQIGDNTSGVNRPIPTDVNGLLAGVETIAAGGSHSCALKTDGSLWCWGNNVTGQLGNGESGTEVYTNPTPRQVIGLEGIDLTGVVAGNLNTCALISGGGLMCWGNNSYGAVGTGNAPNVAPEYTQPVAVINLSGEVMNVTVGQYHVCALIAGGSIQCWGHDEHAELGDGVEQRFSATPVDVIHLTGAVALAAGGQHTCAVTADGHVECWGWGTVGQLGDDVPAWRMAPTKVIGLPSGVSQVSSGSASTCVLMQNDDVLCWGSNGAGQLGDGTYFDRLAPVAVSDVQPLTQSVVAGEAYSCLLTRDGGVRCWGSNTWGYLGVGFPGMSSGVPVNVVGLESGIKTIADGKMHACALTVGGGIKCWGDNTYGQLGAETPAQEGTVVDSALSAGVTAIAAGFEFTCALTAEGGVKCWGDNSSGQLGADTGGNPSTVPVDVIGLSSGVKAIAAATFHACALTTEGGVKCWGSNSQGRLGNGEESGSHSTPVDVTGLSSGVEAITSDMDHTCALLSAGGLRCWGDNSWGQLGNGELGGFSAAPVDVIGLSGDVTSLDAGKDHTCVVIAGDSVQCWGSNQYGQLADGTLVWRATPKNVLGSGYAIFLPLLRR